MMLIARFASLRSLPATTVAFAQILFIRGINAYLVLKLKAQVVRLLDCHISWQDDLKLNVVSSLQSI